MQDLLFDTPWWLLGALVVIAVAVLVSGNKRQDKRLMLTAGLVLVLAAGMWLVSWLVETPREIVTRKTRQMVRAVVERDQGTLRAMLHPNATLEGWGRDEIVEGSKVYAERFGLKDASVSYLDVEQQQSLVTAQLSVNSEHTNPAMPFDRLPSTWELNWLKSEDEWLLHSIVPLKVMSMDRDQVSRQWFSEKPQ